MLNIPSTTHPSSQKLKVRSKKASTFLFVQGKTFSFTLSVWLSGSVGCVSAIISTEEAREKIRCHGLVNRERHRMIQQFVPDRKIVTFQAKLKYMSPLNIKLFN